MHGLHHGKKKRDWRKHGGYGKEVILNIRQSRGRRGAITGYLRGSLRKYKKASDRGIWKLKAGKGFKKGGGDSHKQLAGI